MQVHWNRMSFDFLSLYEINIFMSQLWFYSHLSIYPRAIKIFSFFFTFFMQIFGPLGNKKLTFLLCLLHFLIITLSVLIQLNNKTLKCCYFLAYYLFMGKSKVEHKYFYTHHKSKQNIQQYQNILWWNSEHIK